MQTIDNFVSTLSKQIWEELNKKGLKGLGISGSYARGDYSKSRPDVNFALFLEEETPEVTLTLGKVVSNLNTNFSSELNLCSDYHPERFIYPFGHDKTKPDIFFKIAIFSIKEKDLPMPFGRPGYVLEGHKLSIKMLYGENYFKDMVVTSNNDQVLKGVLYTLPQWQKQSKLAPLAYNLEKDTDLFFNEAMIWGKIIIQQYAWIQGLKSGLDYSRSEDRAVVFSKIHNKEELRAFIELPENLKKKLNLILDARLNFLQMRDDRAMAETLYLATSDLAGYFIGEAKRIGQL